jgi:hypothetical protein
LCLVAAGLVEPIHGFTASDSGALWWAGRRVWLRIAVADRNAADHLAAEQLVSFASSLPGLTISSWACDCYVRKRGSGWV